MKVTRFSDWSWKNFDLIEEVFHDSKGYILHVVSYICVISFIKQLKGKKRLQSMWNRSLTLINYLIVL